MKHGIKMPACFLAAAVACLLTWPQAMGAATPDDGAQAARPGLDFRFDKDVFGVPGAQTPAGTGTPQKFSRLAIRLYGAYSWVKAGDINDGSDGFFELLEAYAALGLGTVTDGYDPVHGGYNFGADVVFQLSPMFGIGLGVGYQRNSSDPGMTLTAADAEITLSGKPTLSAMPIRLGIFLTFPLGGKLSLTGDAGAAYYAGLKFDATQRIEFSFGDWMSQSVSGSRSSFANLGFQGSLGVEYRLSPTMGFFVEAVGRYARFKNFDTVTGITEDNVNGPDTSVGKLYIATYTSPDLTYSVFSIEETPPVDEPDVTFREPKIDLSGFSLQTGIRIRF
jgi:opacity protein-like surface antigen